MVEIYFSEDKLIYVSFPYQPHIVSAIKLIKGHRWNPVKKHWSFPQNIEVVDQLLNIFTTEEINKNSYTTLMNYRKEFLNNSEPNILFYKRLKEELKLKGYSLKTNKAYLDHIKRFLLFNTKGFEDLMEEDIRKYLLELIEIRHNSNSFVNQAYSALKFYYRFIKKDDDITFNIPRCKKDKVLPVVINRDDTVKILSALDNLKHKAILVLIYSSGLRVSEAVRIKISDIDSKRKMLRVRQGKGRKDRYTVLSDNAIEVLRCYVKKYRPEDWLFSGEKENNHLTERSVQKIFENACKKASVKKEFSVHSLRHSFATHLLEDGIDIKFIQELLGHQSCKTTEIYTHVSETAIGRIKSPLDRIIKSSSVLQP